MVRLQDRRAGSDRRGPDPSVSPSSIADRLEEKPLLKIIPHQLQAKVYIPNSAIGFIQPGQADVAVNSFPRGDYGFIPPPWSGSAPMPSPQTNRDGAGHRGTGLFSQRC